MQAMNRDLFYEILDCIDLAIKMFNDRKREYVGIAIHSDNPEDRKKHLQSAEIYQTWLREVELTRETFLSEFAPINE